MTRGVWVMFFLLAMGAGGALQAQEHGGSEAFSSRVVRVALLQDYNTRVVMAGTVMLGATSGLVGVFMLLRRRSLLGDVVGHASLPGIMIAFLVMETISAGSGKWLPGLLIGAMASGFLGVLCVTWLKRNTRIKEDATMAIVLSVFFGGGIALMTAVQKSPSGNAAGLNSFVFGSAAAMTAADVQIIGLGALGAMALCLLLFKELTVLCFDEEFAAARGWPTHTLDLALMLLIVSISVIGIQSVGLILVVAILILPSSAARFWTDDLRHMAWIAVGFGGASAYFGVLISALFPRLAAGAVIVLAGSVLFAFSMVFGARRGVLRRWRIHRRLTRQVGRHDLLRTVFELWEQSGQPPGTPLAGYPIETKALLSARTWSPAVLHRWIKAAAKEGLIATDGSAARQLTALGAREAKRVVRNHRLWEVYLITYADIAPSHVDRSADAIEHILDCELLEELETLLQKQYPEMEVPPSPHEIENQ